MNKFLFIISICSLILGCSIGASKSNYNDGIDTEIREEIIQLDKRIIRALNNVDRQKLKELMSQRLIDSLDTNTDEFLKKVGEIISTNDFQVLGHHHFTNTSSNINNTAISGVSSLNDYIISYIALNDEMFVSTLIIDEEYDKFLVTNIYGKYPDGWKLNILQFGQYTLYGRTAPEFYEIAKEKYNSGYLIDAANELLMGSKVKNPANKFWQYRIEDDIKQLYNKIISEINSMYNFPEVLDEIESKPKIINIYPKEVDEGYFPMIEYVTSVDLKDTVSTKLENDNIHQRIGSIYEGIDKDKQFIFYKAFSAMPDGKTPIPTYGFVKELK